MPAQPKPAPDPNDIPPLQEYERQFRQKFGREMTAEEKKFYQLTHDLLTRSPEENRND